MVNILMIIVALVRAVAHLPPAPSSSSYCRINTDFSSLSFPLQKSDVGLSEEQLEQLLDKLDVDGDGEINFRSL